MFGRIPFIIIGTLSPLIVYILLLKDIRTLSGRIKGLYFKNKAFPHLEKDLAHMRTRQDEGKNSAKRLGDWFKDGSVPPLAFDFLIQPTDLCPSGETLGYIMMIYSATSNFKNRQTIRETFGSRNASQYVSQRVVFLLGSVNTTMEDHGKITERIQKESKKHGDLVQGDFVDSYNNLTLKGLAGIRWVDKHCKNVKFVMKADDDTFVNIFRVIDAILPKIAHVQYLISGMIHNKKANQIIRLGDGHAKRFQAKWSVPDTVFPGMTHYPFQYPNGLFVIMSRDLIRPMVEAARKVPFFYLEDVYLYGLLSDVIGNVTMVGLNGFLNGKGRRSMRGGYDCFSRLGASCDVIAVFDGGEKVVRNLWRLSTKDKTYKTVIIFAVAVFHVVVIVLCATNVVRYLHRRGGRV